MNQIKYNTYFLGTSSTLIEIGKSQKMLLTMIILLIAVVRSEGKVMVSSDLHLSSMPSQGQLLSVSMPPLSLMYLKAQSMSPPLQPLLPYCVEQSIKFCSESDTRNPVLRKCWPSRAPVCRQTLVAQTSKQYIQQNNRKCMELKVKFTRLMLNVIRSDRE